MLRTIATITLAMLTTPLALAGDSEAGKSLYGTCIACHGAAGEGNPALNSPALAGQQAAYLERQLKHFKNGVRGSDPRDSLGMQMRGVSATLADDAAIANVVAYIGTFAPSQGQPRDFDRRNGENQYNAACGACHGATAEGNSALNAPRLAGLDAAYLERQYRNFASGVRGSHPDDRLGAQMKMMATMLATDKDLADVIGFIVSQ